MSDHRNIDLENLSGSIALHAASPEEEAAFAAYLADAEQARYELIELQDTAVQLGLSVEPVEPPAELTRSILDLVATTPQLGAVETAPVRHLVPRRRRRSMRGVIVGVALLAAAAVIGVVVVQVAAPHTSSYSQISAASDARHGTASITGGGSVTATWSQATRAAAVRLDGVSPAGTGKTYELWYVTPDGTATAAGLVPTKGGEWTTLSGTMTTDASIAITIEPSGGSAQPTSTPIAVIPTA